MYRSQSTGSWNRKQGRQDGKDVYVYMPMDAYFENKKQRGCLPACKEVHVCMYVHVLHAYLESNLKCHNCCFCITSL